jgi:hypothetical protein
MQHVECLHNRQWYVGVLQGAGSRFCTSCRPSSMSWRVCLRPSDPGMVSARCLPSPPPPPLLPPSSVLLPGDPSAFDAAYVHRKRGLHETTRSAQKDMCIQAHNLGGRPGDADRSHWSWASGTKRRGICHAQCSGHYNHGSQRTMDCVSMTARQSRPQPRCTTSSIMSLCSYTSFMAAQRRQPGCSCKHVQSRTTEPWSRYM